MKKVFLLVIGFVVTAICATNSYGQTTLDEYNFITNGCMTRNESVKGTNSNYEFELIDKQHTKERLAELSVMYRLRDGAKEVAAYMIVYNRTGRQAEYICVPRPGSSEEITSRYWDQLYGGDKDSSLRLQLISYMISKQVR